MIIPGAAWSTDFDRGSFIERVNQVSLAAPAGALTIAPDGQYTWRKRAGTVTGQLEWCVSTNGKTGRYQGKPIR